MTPGERILLRMEAQSCWPGARLPARAKVRSVEPVVVNGGGAEFGLTLLNAPSIADLQNIMVNWDTRMKGLAQAYADFSPTWIARDQAAYVDWTNDWVNLQARYNAALSAAQTAVTEAKFVLAPNTEIDATTAYTGLAKAMRQCYPPDGCPAQKGDWDDLDTRLRAAGKTPVYAPMVQPTVAQEGLSGQLYTALAPVDVVAQVTGQQQGGPLPTGTGDQIAKILAWLATHKTAVEVGAIMIVGGIVISALVPLLALPLKVAKIAAL